MRPQSRPFRGPHRFNLLFQHYRGVGGAPLAAPSSLSRSASPAATPPAWLCLESLMRSLVSISIVFLGDFSPNPSLPSDDPRPGTSIPSPRGSELDADEPTPPSTAPVSSAEKRDLGAMELLGEEKNYSSAEELELRFGLILTQSTVYGPVNIFYSFH